VRRSLTIRTDPPGALIYVNDQLKGESPVTYDFQWYGWHRVMVRKEGFERVEDRQLLRSPAYLWIPFDLAMELLPFPIRDERTWHYTLSPAAISVAPTPPTEPGHPPKAGGRGSAGAKGGGPSAAPAEAKPVPKESSDGITR